MSRADLTTMAGSQGVTSLPRMPFNDLDCAFLTALSAALRQKEVAKAHADMMTFAFWCRAGNIEKLKARYAGIEKRLGRGLAFHIAPSNVPINFAYSFAFSLLAGNTNIVRVPSRDLAQVDVICGVIDQLLHKDEFTELHSGMSFIRYPADGDFTRHYSMLCDARIVWGGDATVAEIRKLPLSPRAVELVFPDRYSLCVIDPASIIALSDQELARVADGFFNDTYLMDQNACSSPHLIVWLGADTKNASQARTRFWAALRIVVQKRYSLAAIQAVDKYTLLLEAAIEGRGRNRLSFYGNDIYTVEIATLPNSIDQLRGKFGMFYEYVTNDLIALVPLVNDKFQTLTYHGVDKERLRDFVINNRLRGIDRIVPIGQALDIDTVWDGQDIIRHLSRIVDAR